MIEQIFYHVVVAAIHRSLDAFQKLTLLGGQMGLEPAEEARPAPAGPCGYSPQALRRALREPGPEALSGGGGLDPKKDSLGIHQAVMPGGRRIALLKTLLTSACERDCYYCPFRAGRDYRRATFKPDEMAAVFSRLHRAGTAEGLFLSSGIAAGGARTQDRLLDTAEILRRREGFRGYLHLKLMPGAERGQVQRAMQLADRLSINLEAPNTERLGRLAPHKVFVEELLRPLEWVEELRRAVPFPGRGDGPGQAPSGRWPSTATQLVVGGAGESDVEILTTTQYVLRRLRLARVYFSAFHPVPDTPLESHPAENPWREHRLYQASFLLRDYGFELEDMPFTQGGRLPLEVDPKLGWARQNLRERPVELNRAARGDLLRVPGIGPRGADIILQARRHGTLRELRDLQRLGVRTGPAAPFILLAGRRPAHQLPLFAESGDFPK